MERSNGKERDPSQRIELADIEHAWEFMKTASEDEARFPESPVTPELARMNIEHTERVRKNAAKIATGEGLDGNLLEMAALLHDIQKLDHHDKESGGIDTWHHHHRSASLAKKFLLGIGKSAELAEKIEQIIARHSDIPFIRRYWEKNYGKGVPSPESPEEIALRDADTLDHLDIRGIYKIVHFRQKSGSDFYKEDRGNIQKAIASAHKSFVEAADVILTGTGKTMLREFIGRAEEFFKRLQEVKDISGFDTIYNEFVG